MATMTDELRAAMIQVRDVETTSYQFGLILQDDGSLLPIHLCTMVTRDGDVHGFLWEGEAV